jgi:glyoxylase I family protein
LDHIGLAAGSREELEQWQRRFDDQGVPYTPIRDMEMGYHLNFRDPDNIALELSAPNELWLTAQRLMATGGLTAADIAAFVSENLSPDLVVGKP